MSVFFDPPVKYTFRGKDILSSHLMADTSEELLAFARRIGLKPAWIQEAGTDKEHFDLMNSRIEVAERAGAERLSRTEFVRRWKARRIAP